MSSHHFNKPIEEVNGFSLYYSGDIAIVVIDRGQNRLNLEFCQTFLQMLDKAEKNESCKGFVTTAVGKFYGNGLDLDWMAVQSDAALAEFFSSFMTCLKRVLLSPLPTLAAMNGHCYAGTGLLAFAHDFRTMRVDRGWLCFNEVFINRKFSDSGYKMLRAKMGTGITSTDAIIMGRRYTATQAQASGLVHAVPTETLLIPESLRLMKSYMGPDGYPREGLEGLKEDMYKEVADAYDVEIGVILEEKAKL